MCLMADGILYLVLELNLDENGKHWWQPNKMIPMRGSANFYGNSCCEVMFSLLLYSYVYSTFATGAR